MPQRDPRGEPTPEHFPRGARRTSEPHFEATLCVDSVCVAAIFSLVIPQAGQLAALVACMLCAAHCKRLLPVALLIFCHSGSVIVSSRTLDAESSDFAVYFDLFSSICTNSVSATDSLFQFGPEIGLPLLYHVVSLVGGCALSINGLAYMQTIVVSFLVLGILCTYGMRDQKPSHAASIVGGILTLFSFVYVTQLSRQTLSSVFILAALLAQGKRSLSPALVLLSTMFHLTGPVIFCIAVGLRKMSRTGVVSVMGAMGGLALLGPTILPWAIENMDTFVGLDKLNYYALTQENTVIGSDLRALFYLLLAGLISIPRSERAKPETVPDTRLLLGFALLALALLELPLAATRLTLAFSSIGIGYFLFRGLSINYPRILVPMLIAALIFRSGLFDIFGTSDQILWQAYSQSSILPLYYAEHYLRPQ